MAQNEMQITGFVFDNGKPLSSVVITNLHSNSNTLSNQKGQYKINMKQTDTLKFSHLGFHDEFKTLKQGQFVINVNLRPKVVELDEVAVSKASKRRKSQKELELEYGENPALIKTQFGIIDKETAGHAMYVLSDTEFNSNAPDLATAIAGRFPNRGPSNSIYNSTQAGSGPTPIYDVDGMIFTNPPNIMPAAIERIAYIPGLSGATLYGTLGNSGVIIINTKVGTFSGRKQNQKFLPNANNVYDGSALNEDEAYKYLPSNLKVLIQADDFDAAKRFYKNQITSDNADPYFSIEALKIFHEKWGPSSFTEEIFDNCFSMSKNDEAYLLSLAYVAEELNAYQSAEQIFKECFVKVPNKHISYKNLYSLYQLMGDENRVKSISLRYFYLIEKGYLSDETDPVSRFFKRSVENSPDNRDNPNEDIGLYLVVEWNNPSANFELQFVGPDNKYFFWNNSEVISGSFLEDFFLDESSRGNWQLNATYLGNDKNTPTYIKLTFYFNYGKNRSAQSMRVRTFRLGEVGINKKLISFDTRSLN